MNLENIANMDSVEEIYEYIIRNSCKIECINKNLPVNEWYDYKNDMYCYLVNSYIDKKDIQSSLDLLMISNTKAFRLIYLNETDLENIIQGSRVAIYYILLDYYNGLYDNQIYKQFGFRVNGDIEKFKLLFTKENVDKFVSFILVKCKQDERRNLPNRYTKREKNDEGKYCTVFEYVNINMCSYEESYENKNIPTVEQQLCLNGEVLNDTKEIEVYRDENIYSYLVKYLHLLTDKQKEFINYYLNIDLGSYDYLFKENDSYMNKQLKCSYRRNIQTKLIKVLENSPHVKVTNKGYYILIKTDKKHLIEKLKRTKDIRDKFEIIAKELKGNNEVTKYLVDIIIDEDCMKYFVNYYENGYSKDVYRFVYGKKFKLIIERICV